MNEDESPYHFASMSDGTEITVKDPADWEKVMYAMLGGKPPSRWRRLLYRLRHGRRMGPYTHTFSSVPFVGDSGKADELVLHPDDMADLED